MESYQTGEIVLLSFPFSNAIGSRRRPALVLIDTGDEDIIVARITSQMAQINFDAELSEWQSSGLLMPSVVRLHKLATLQKQLVDRRLGMLTSSDWRQVQAKIQELWALI
jgi:mRNA interferase MazF